MKRLPAKILLAAFAVLAALFLARNLIARKSVEIAVERLTGFPIEIGSVNLALFSSRIDARNIKLLNPPGFREKLFLELPQLHLDYRLGSILAGAPHINEMLLDIHKLVIVKNDKGESNAMKLKGVLSRGNTSGHYRIDTLRVRIGTVTTVDRTGKTRNLPLNLTATYHNITDSTDITRLVLLTALSQTRLPDIGIKPDELKKGLEGVVGTAAGLLNAAGETGKELLDTLQPFAPREQKP
jgi:hypothetical protein